MTWERRAHAPRSPVRRMVRLVVLVVATGGCDDNTQPAPSGRWDCPLGWMSTALGGCGPAALLCAPDGGAAPGTCSTATTAPSIALADGGTVEGLRRLAGGDFGGAWPTPSNVDGPPPEGWSPDAGIAACAPGWHPLDDRTCDPALAASCPAGAFALPGGACTPTAPSDCPASEYADPGADAVGARVVRARAGASSAGADGSEAMPYPTLAQALAAAGNGGWVLLAAGEYRGSLAVTGDAHIVGVCAARATIAGGGAVTLDVRGPGARLDLRGVTVRGDGRGIQVRGGGALQAKAIVVDSAGRVGMLIGEVNTRVDLESSVVRGTHAGLDGITGHGVEVIEGATLRASSCVVADNRGPGVLVSGVGSSAGFERCVVRANAIGMTATGAHGLAGYNGASVRLSASIVEDNANVAIVSFLDADVAIEESIVRRTRPVADAAQAVGLQALRQGTIRVADTLVTDNVAVGAIARGASARLELRASIVRDTTPSMETGGGVGVLLEDGGVLTATGLRIEGNQDINLRASGAGTRAELASCVIRGARPRTDGSQGYGVLLFDRATLTSSDLLVAEHHGAGVALHGADTSAALRRCVVRDTRLAPPGFGGAGLSVEAGAALVASQMLVLRCGNVGVGASGPAARAELTACVVRDTLPRGADESGVGLGVERGATLVAARSLVTGSTTVGAVATGEGSRLELLGSAVLDTRANGMGTFGRGIEASGGASLALTATLVARSREAGVLVMGSRATLSDVWVLDVGPSQRGLGVGIYGSDAAIDATRVAVEHVAGAGLTVHGSAEPTSTRELFVRRVDRSTLILDERGGTATPEGARVAYGLHVGVGGVLDAEGVTVLDGDLGFYNAGRIIVRRGLFAEQREGLGAQPANHAPTAASLRDVISRGNATDAVRARDLPIGGALPAARAPCVSGACE